MNSAPGPMGSALCINGPLRGRILTGSLTRGFQAIDDREPDDIVTYRTERFLFRSGGRTVTVWLAYTGAQYPSASEVADVLLSSEAKACMEETV